MNTIPHQETPTEAADDIAAFGETHAAALRETSHAFKLIAPAVRAESIYTQAHNLRVAYIASLTECTA